MNNGETGGDVSDDESSSSSSGSGGLADKFASGMRNAVHFIEQEMRTQKYVNKLIY